MAQKVTNPPAGSDVNFDVTSKSRPLQDTQARLLDESGKTGKTARKLSEPERQAPAQNAAVPDEALARLRSLWWRPRIYGALHALAPLGSTWARFH